MTASTGTTGRDAALPGVAARINPPAAPPKNPARPPPIDAPAHRAAASAAARRSLRVTSSRAVARGAGSPRIGTGPDSAASHRVSRNSARANAWRGRVPMRRSASDVPSACSNSAASRCSSSSPALAATRVTRCIRGSYGSTATSDGARRSAGETSPTCHSAWSSSSTTSAKTNWYPWRETVRTNRGSRESSPSTRRIVRMAWLRALSETMTSLQMRSKISRRCTASPRRSIRYTSRSKYRGMSGCSRPLRRSIRRRGDRMNSLKR